MKRIGDQFLLNIVVYMAVNLRWSDSGSFQALSIGQSTWDGLILGVFRRYLIIWDCMGVGMYMNDCFYRYKWSGDQVCENIGLTFMSVWWEFSVGIHVCVGVMYDVDTLLENRTRFDEYIHTPPLWVTLYSQSPNCPLYNHVWCCGL